MIITILGGAVACPFAAFGQVSSGRPLVAVLLGGSATNAVFLNSFLRGVQEIGCVEGRDIDIVTRYAEGDLTRAAALAADLIRLTERASLRPPVRSLGKRLVVSDVEDEYAN